MTICFTAIVRNESHVIRRCIESCIGAVDRYSVTDTGSLDGTQAAIAAHFKAHDIPGEVVQSDWKGFGESRTEAIHNAQKSGANYLLMMDADHTLGGKIGELTLDAYQIQHRYGNIQYGLPILFSAKRQWRYEMPVHEYLVAESAIQGAVLQGAWIDVHPDGARSKDSDKFSKDAEVLEAFCKEKPDHARAHYYWAQSLRDAGRLEAAFDRYVHRGTMKNGFDEEQWSAKYEAGKIVGRLGGNPTPLLLDAFNLRPTRTEPLWALAHWNRLQGNLALAYVYARRAAEIPRPNDQLFVEHEVYSWMVWDELSISAWYAGEKDVSRAAFKKIDLSIVPQPHLGRLNENREWYV